MIVEQNDSLAGWWWWYQWGSCGGDDKETTETTKMGIFLALKPISHLLTGGS